MTIRLRAALTLAADVALIGILVLIGSLPVVTVPAALAGGSAAFRFGTFREQCRAFWHVWRHSAFRGSVVGIVGAAAGAAGLLDAVILGPGVGGMMGAFLAVGGLLMGAATSALVIACAVMLTVRVNIPGVLRGAGRLIVLFPARGLASLVLLVAAVAAVAAFPPGIVVVLGMAALVANRIERAADRKLGVTTGVASIPARQGLPRA
jgi:hypothetical protein